MTPRRPLMVLSIPILTLLTVGLLIAEDATGTREFLLGAYGSLAALAIAGGIVVRKLTLVHPYHGDEPAPSSDDIERAMADNVSSPLTAKAVIERTVPDTSPRPELVLELEPEPEREMFSSMSSSADEVLVPPPVPDFEPAPESGPETPIVLSPAAELFVNLERRNKQLNRQMLTLIAHLERDELDPDTLQGLYELDHLATRTRRTQDVLLMLASPRRVRQWSPPVPLEDVVRSALAEIERFSRVELDHIPDVQIEGSAVADLTHLLAELLDNATEFSHTSTLVSVSANTSLEGLEIEVLDSGHGMDQSKLDDLNALLHNPPRVEDAPARRLGLFVAAHIAEGLGIDIELSGQRDVGTAATVTVPNDLLIESEEPVDESADALEALELLDPVLQLAVGAELAEDEEDELATASLPTDEEVADALASFPSVEIVNPEPSHAPTVDVFPAIADLPEPLPEPLPDPLPEPGPAPLPSRVPQATFESVWGDDAVMPMPTPEVTPVDSVPEFDESQAKATAFGAASSISAFSAGVSQGLADAEAELSNQTSEEAEPT